MVAELRTFNLADIWEAVSDRVADRTAVVCRNRRLTYAQLEERANRLANWMIGRGVEPGQHVGLYLQSGTEYFEAMLAAYKVRAVPININYRYVEDELVRLFEDADLVGVFFNRQFAVQGAAIKDRLPSVSWWLDVDDLSGQTAVIAGAVAYEDALASASSERAFGERSDDDRYVIYTGGTTGTPKGVVWRHADAFFSCIGGGDPMRLLGPVEHPHEVLDRIIDGSFAFLPVAPLMHAAGQWTSLSLLFAGGKVVLLPGSLDAGAVWHTIEDEKVNLAAIVGDAVARPLVDAWESEGPFEVSSLLSIGSGGAPLAPTLRRRLMEILPGCTIVDGFGSSETGAQGSQRIEAGAAPTAGVARFVPYGNTTVVLDEATLQPVEPGSGGVGRVALRGHIPLAYHNDPVKTAETFVEVDGSRWVLTGDMATVDLDGAINLLGRGSGCINTGGEKVYPEEVEAALKDHPDVYDAVVVGVDDDRWGSKVVAVVQPVEGQTPSRETLAEHCRASLAGFKVPKRVVLVAEVKRSPAGKADYLWARSVAEAGRSG